MAGLHPSPSRGERISGYDRTREKEKEKKPAARGYSHRGSVGVHPRAFRLNSTEPRELPLVLDRICWNDENPIPFLRCLTR
mmetsp:Transcript_2174/g.4951  ORF Transcript_2174/g.4951 Transcript_2174/m.4951 type:complete len:81 (-) Transcript_2174:85-327(-)